MARSSTGKHFCQSELQGKFNNRSLVAVGVVFNILQCWKDVNLQTYEYSQQVKYKGQVTTTTENEYNTIWISIKRKGVLIKLVQLVFFVEGGGARIMTVLCLFSQESGGGSYI